MLIEDLEFISLVFSSSDIRVRACARRLVKGLVFACMFDYQD